MTNEADLRWNAGEELDLGRYRQLAFRDRYLKIYDFLRNEHRVNEGLALLERATGGMNQAKFRDYLAAEEQRFGFARQLGVITVEDDLVKASKFWLYLMQRQAIVDMGAGDDDHGVLIHRVQWVLAGQWNERSGHTLGPSGAIGELYQNLGSANARVLTETAARRMATGWKLNTGAKNMGRIFDSVWDEIFDASWPRQDATRPEYLRAYIQARYSALYARMRW
jgi:hypothetical protein